MMPGSFPPTNKPATSGVGGSKTGTIISIVASMPLIKTKAIARPSIPPPTPQQFTNQLPLPLVVDRSEALNSVFADMFQRVVLPRPAAIEVSQGLWPDRHQGFSNAAAYLEWHKKARPGGSLHPPDRSNYPVGINVRASSIQEIASTLVLMMNHFHSTRDDPEISSGDFQPPEGVRCTPIDSLRVFFRDLRCYLM